MIPDRYKLFQIIFANIFLLFTFCSSQGTGVGQRIDLTSKLNLGSGQFAQLFIPDYFSPADDGNFTLVFHLHSASWAAEDEVYKSGVNTILFNIHLGGFSSSYQNYFNDQSKFQTIMDLVKSELESNQIITQPEISKLIVTSFSAGYAGVREMFKNIDYYKQIDALTLADGLHSSSNSSLMQDQMKDFLRFAKDARDLSKIMFITHSQIPTSGYESTTSTANYLINGIGATREEFSVTDEVGTQLTKCDTGFFHLKGYAGETANDHMKHLYGMHLMLKSALDILEPTSLLNTQGNFSNIEFFQLGNYPNPFNSTTTITYSLPKPARVRIEIFDTMGRLVNTLVSGSRSAGRHQVRWNASEHSAGLYYYQLQANQQVKTGKCLLLI